MIDRYGHAFIPGRADHAERLVTFSPQGLVGNLEMRNFYRNIRLLADCQAFGDRFFYINAFVAHVRGVNAAIFLGDFCKFDNLFGLCKHSGKILETG